MIEVALRIGDANKGIKPVIETDEAKKNCKAPVLIL
jgi:hypothetical protein